MIAASTYSNNLLSSSKVDTLYGNKVSDILSFLPAELKDKYNELGKQRRDVLETNGKASANQDDPMFANESGYDNYRQFQSDMQTKELENSLKGLSGKDKTQAYEVTKAQLVKQNSIPLFTMDDSTKTAFIKAAGSNPMYMMQLEKAIDELYKTYANRLQFGVQRNPMTNKISQVPFYKSGGFSATAKFESTSVETRLSGAASVIYQLVAIGAIEPAAELKVRPISLADGKFKITKEEVEYNQIARKLKLPLKGTFLVNDRTTNVGKRYATFSGTDVSVSYALGYYVGNIEGLRSITWSISRGKSNVPLTEEVNAVSRARGRRCIPATEKVYIKDKGLIPINEVMVGDLVQSTPTEFNKVLGVHKEGKKLCNNLKLYNGYDIIASYDHPIYTERGWINTEELTLKDKVYVSAGLPFTNDRDIIEDDILILIAYLIGDGAIHRYLKKGGKSWEHRISLAISDKEMDSIGIETEQILNKLNIPFRDSRNKDSKCISRTISVCIGTGQTDWKQRVYNDLHKALLNYGLYDTYSSTKFIPQDFVANLNKRQASLFLSRLFSTDGCYCISGTNDKYIDARYCSTSELLIDQIRIMLNKFNICSIKSSHKKAGQVGGRSNIISKHDSYELTISNCLDLSRFIKTISIFSKDHLIKDKYDIIVSRIVSTLEVDYKLLLDKITQVLQKNNQKVGKFLDTHNFNRRNCITVKHALKIANLLKDQELIDWVNLEVEKFINGINKDFLKIPVKSNTKLEELEVYDLEVEERHAFVCEHMLVHNTIAGTMIFAMFDEHPITAIYPESYFPQDDEFSADSPIRQQFLKPDQLPAFDLSLIFTNEYGYNSILTLFGVEIMDDSGVINIDDLVNENVIHYTAKDIDLLHSVKTDKNGIIDLYELQSLQSDSLWKRRSQIVYGEEGNSFYEQHAAYYDKIYSSSGYPTITK